MAPLAVNPASSLSILFGSQTGTAEEVAWDLAREGRARGFSVVDPAALNELSIEALQSLRFAVFVVSTTGQGDPPVNMRKLWQELLLASLPKTLLSGLRFAVFGLGDTHYREFNYAARKLHARLKGLGAEPFFCLGLGDDQHDFGLEQELDPWAESMWAALEPLHAPRPLQERVSSDGDCRYSVEFVDEPASDGPSAAAASGAFGPEDFEATVISNGSLCTVEHAMEEQDVRNICLRVPSGFSYEAGDVAVVWPRADAKLVQRFVVETLGLQLGTRVRVRPRGIGEGAAASSPFPDEPISLEEVFTSYVDISSVPSRHFFSVLSRHTDDELHRKKLSEFASRTLEAKDALYEYCKREKRSAAEVMWDFWTARPPLAELLSCLPPMRPRRYSIASSPTWHQDAASCERAAQWWLRSAGACRPAWGRWTESRAAVGVVARALHERERRLAPDEGGCKLDLCVAIVRFTTKTGRQGRGLCSTFLQDSPIGASIRCSFERGTLSPLPVSVPMIMVCPGTGLSPCRALVQARHAQLVRQEARGERDARWDRGLKDLMFLGFRHQEGDYLYGEEWQRYKAWLSVHVAFSRDHPDRKVYVQDCIEEQGSRVCDLLDAGAQILVCGRAHPMPAQVFDAFTEVLHLGRGLTMDAAAARLREMQRTHRYICDTWG